jgi:hypothetical protein
MLPAVDLGALTIPIFVALFAAGWTTCVRVLVLPMRERMKDIEAKLDQIERERDIRLATLEARRTNR